MGNNNNDLHFLIIATGWNCKRYVKRCIDSVRTQIYENWTAIYVDDASGDGTGQEIEKHLRPDYFESGVYSEKNFGAAYHRYKLLKEMKDLQPKNTVVLLLGLDDYLLPDALERIKEEYEKGAWMTYGNWRGTDGYELPEGFLHYSDAIHRERYYRSVQYRATAPNTFYLHLFDHFQEDDFKHEGEWIKATTESNLMLSLLEMCGKSRIGVIEDVIYIYENNRSDKAAWRFGRPYQDAILKEVKKKPIRKLL